MGPVRRGRREGEQKKRWEHQGMDRPEVHQVPEGCGKLRKMEESACEIVCGASTTPAVKEWVKATVEAFHTK